MAGGGTGTGGEPEITLEHTPTWIVAAVCSVIVVISLVFERLLHGLGKVRYLLAAAASHPAPTVAGSVILVLFSLTNSKHLLFMHEQRLKKGSKKPLYDALLKIKEG